MRDGKEQKQQQQQTTRAKSKPKTNQSRTPSPGRSVRKISASLRLHFCTLAERWQVEISLTTLSCAAKSSTHSFHSQLVSFERNPPCKQVREFVTEHDQKQIGHGGKWLHREPINWEAYLFSEFGMWKLWCCELNRRRPYCQWRGAGCVREALSD